MLPMFLGEATTISVTDFESILTTLQNQISVQSVVSVLAVAAGAAVGFAFMWWGVRKLTSVLMKGFTKGKVKP